MTTTAPPSPVAPRRSPVRGILIGVAIGLAFVLVAVLVFAVTRTPQRDVDYLSPTSGSPVGARAVVNVLREQGVDVEIASTLADLRDLEIDPRATTLVVYDYYLVLGSAQREDLLALADRLVVMDPWDEELTDFAPGVVLDVDASSGVYPADCDLPAAVRAGEVEGTPYGYDTSDAENETLGCFETGDDIYAVVQTRTAGTEVVLVGVSQAFTNDAVLDAGNAAFALNLLGEDETLVWYLPGLAELDSGDVPTPQSLTPPWVTPVILLLLFLTLVAGVWKGRRLGPLVAEKLPVIVRSNETMEGRARLYERAGAREHALDSLRIGTISRLASACGLPKRSTVDEVIDTVARLTGRDREGLSDLLVDRIPTGDAALVRLSDELLRLEADTIQSTRGR
ncbi:DUF4350 domain-containing protein [Pseudolysinimonas sp.]|jgi:hypothetical protein|uniref:DUF4350 domain-containing protein n=1 Tax=Pseudolysinimonas sp. TaxID=2680009 RepID=UPI003783BAEC